MGRRSTNTTKSGKYMNPTDRARKEARRKELKKNKKQRMAVRQAVLKSKDAVILLEEATLYDQQEYDPKSGTTLSERVLQEKRKKLMETYDRMIALYRKEDPDKATELQAMRNDYDKKRNEMIQFYDQVKLAEKVKATEIPLPEIPPQNLAGLPQYPGDIPLPPGLNVPPHPAILAAAAMTSAVVISAPAVPARGILKKTTTVVAGASDDEADEDSMVPGPPPGLPTLHRKPAPPPPGTPTELSDVDSSDEEDDDDDDSSSVSSDVSNHRSRKRRHSSEEAPVDLERESERTRKIRFAADRRAVNSDDDNDDDRHRRHRDEVRHSRSMDYRQLPPPSSRLPVMMHPVHMLPPPPNFMHLSSIPVPADMPPPVPIGSTAPGLHPHATAIAMPPQMFGQSAKQQRISQPQANKKSSDVPATSNLNRRPQLGNSTIEAKPQLKNLIGDSTKLVPTSLLTRKSKAVGHNIRGTFPNRGDGHHTGGRTDGGTSKDHAYDQFMKEMEGLL